MAYEQFAYTYDRLMREMPYGEWLNVAKEGWRRYGITPQTVVDLGCGTGSISIPLAQEGYRVTGIDLSEDMLAVAQQKSAAVGLTNHYGQAPEWVQQDLREWELGAPADAVISFCDCFNYLLEEEDIIQAFKQTIQGLRPGGVFLFDVHTPEQLIVYADNQPFFLNDDDIAYIWTCELDEERLEIEHDLSIFIKESANTDIFRRIEERHVQRAYSLSWFERQLLSVGFIDVQVTADFIWKAPAQGAERAFFAARKPV